MKEILLINPRGKKKTTKKTGRKKAMPKKKATKKRKASTKSLTTKRAPAKRRRRNPSSSTRKAAGKAKNLISSLQISRSVIDSAKQVGGMMACQFFAKRFAEGGGANDPAWNWKNYSWGLAGTFASAIGAEVVKRGSGKEFLKGGLSLLAYKLLANELSQKSEFVATYFGEGDMNTDSLVFEGTDGELYSPGDNYLGDDGEVYLMGQDGVWYPQGMGGALSPPSDLGESLGPASYLGETLAPASTLGNDPYAKVFNRQSMIG